MLTLSAGFVEQLGDFVEISFPKRNKPNSRRMKDERWMAKRE